LNFCPPASYFLPQQQHGAILSDSSVSPQACSSLLGRLTCMEVYAYNLTRNFDSVIPEHKHSHPTLMCTCLNMMDTNNMELNYTHAHVHAQSTDGTHPSRLVAKIRLKAPFTKATALTAAGMRGRIFVCPPACVCDCILGMSTRSVIM